MKPERCTFCRGKISGGKTDFIVYETFMERQYKKLEEKEKFVLLNEI